MANTKLSHFIDLVGKPFVGKTFWVGKNLRKVLDVQDDMVTHAVIEEQDYLA